MKTLPIKLRIGTDCTVSFTEVYPCCGYVRVQGYGEAVNRPAAFEACKEVADRLGKKHLGAYIAADSETEAVCFPFSFDASLEPVRPSYRREEMTEAVRRVMRELRSARIYFNSRNPAKA
jgi:hypothetical protein